MVLARLEESNAAMTLKLSNFTGQTEMSQRKKAREQNASQRTTTVATIIGNKRASTVSTLLVPCCQCGRKKSVLGAVRLFTNAMSWVPFTGVEVSNDNDKIILVNVHTTCCIKSVLVDQRRGSTRGRVQGLCLKIELPHEPWPSSCSKQHLPNPILQLSQLRLWSRSRGSLLLSHCFVSNVTPSCLWCTTCFSFFPTKPCNLQFIYTPSTSCSLFILSVNFFATYFSCPCDRAGNFFPFPRRASRYHPDLVCQHFDVHPKFITLFKWGRCGRRQRIRLETIGESHIKIPSER